MRIRHLLAIPFLCVAMWAQDPALKDTFLQAKTLWATQGDREGATSRFDSVVAALSSKGVSLEPEWVQMLCESYNWLAVLDDRSAQSRPRVQVRLQSLMDLNPDFELDRALTSQRLVALYDRMKGEKFGAIKLTFSPEGGRLLVDGKLGTVLPRKYLTTGPHKLVYSRPGYAPSEVTLELGPRDVKSADFKLVRTSSTLTLYVQPSDVEILLDGQSLGFATGKAGPEAAAIAAPLNLRPENLSSPFIISDLLPGKHRLELRAPCFRTKTLELGADLATPAADHTLEPIRMVASKGTLSVASAWPGGELFLSGQSRGSLPVANAPVCAGPYDLLVRFPGGGYSQRVLIEDGKSLNLDIKPKPRLALLGLESGDFTGRTRFLSLLEALGDRLKTLAFIAPRAGETTIEAMARLKASRETELFLLARPVPEKVVHRVELVVSTLDGEEEHLVVKPLEQDPLGSLVARLNTVPPVQRPGLGISALEVPGEPGPWVLDAAEPALKAGLKVGKPVLQAQGQVINSVAEWQQITATSKGPVSLVQEGATVTLPVQLEAQELPLGSSSLCYPALLAQLRLHYEGAKGDKANLIKLNMALVLMQFRRYDKAIELLRDARLSTIRGVSQGTIDFHTGLCFLHLGASYQSEAIQAFRQALKYPQSTLLGPDGPLVAPLARQALEDLR